MVFKKSISCFGVLGPIDIMLRTAANLPLVLCKESSALYNVIISSICSPFLGMSVLNGPIFLKPIFFIQWLLWLIFCSPKPVFVSAALLRPIFVTANVYPPSVPSGPGAPRISPMIIPCIFLMFTSGSAPRFIFRDVISSAISGNAFAIAGKSYTQSVVWSLYIPLPFWAVPDGET